MKLDNLFLVLSAILAVAAILFAGFAIFSPGITGFITTNQTAGMVNVTVQSGLLINFTTNTIVWGTGKVDTGANNATLDTSRNATYKVINGNWSWVDIPGIGNKTEGFILENVGNVNASIWIATGKNSTQLLGGTGSPAYQFNVTNNESNSCTNASGVNLGYYYDVNTTTTGTQVCSLLEPNNLRDAIRIDILLRIPSESITGMLTDTITATAAIA